MTRVLALLAAIAVLAKPASAELTNADLSLEPRVQTTQIAGLIDEVFTKHGGFTAAHRATIKRIADCESGGKNSRGGPNGLITHLDKRGRLVRNPVTPDVGAMQINRTVHSRHFWARHKLNETEILDNLEYAKALMLDRKKRGQNIFADWSASKPCWTQQTVASYN